MTTLQAHPEDVAEPVVAEGACLPTVAAVVSAARNAQRDWSAVPIARRLHHLRALRHAVAASAGRLAEAMDAPSRTPAERLASEVLPLADAIRFLERGASRLLRPRRFGAGGRPFWLGRTRLEVRREPFGVVLIVSPSNYPLLLAGVQAVQALAAGNAALIKPAPGHAGPVQLLAELAAGAGIDRRLIVVLGEDAQCVHDAARAGVDKVFLTGSVEAGEAVAATASRHLIPAVMELSGHDAVFVCDDADLDVAARCIAYGLTFNGGRTCIAPRRIFVRRAAARALEAKLADSIAAAAAAATPGDAPPLAVVPVRDMEHALLLSNQCPYHLGASVFGGRVAAEQVATRVDAGCVVVNDMIVPTADPRLPFGGRGRSGYGVTRGGEGLLEMTRVKAVSTRRGSFRPHLEPPHPLDADLFRRYLAAAHGASIGERARGAVGVVRALLKRGKS